MADTNDLQNTNENPAEDVKHTGEKTYTESEVNERIQKAVQDRLNRALKKYEGFDDIKTELEDLRTFKNQADEQNLSEMEKLQKQFEAKNKENEDLLSNYNALKEQLKKDKLHNSFKELARQNNIQYVDDALQLASSQLETIEADEDGNFKGIEDIVKNLVEAKPFLLAQVKEEPKPIGNSSNPNQDKVDKSSEALLKEAADKFKLTQRQDDLVAYMQLKRKLSM